jgi:hypothetical protein
MSTAWCDPGACGGACAVGGLEGLARRAFVILAATLLAGTAARVSASGIDDFQIVISCDREVWSSANHPGSITTTSNGDGTYSVRFYGRVPGEWTARFVLTVDPDPFVYGLFAVMNDTSTTKNFQAMVVEPAAYLAGPTTMSGSISGTVLDRNGDGATLATLAGAPMYTAMIDGVSQQTLVPDYSSCVAGAYMTNAFGPASFNGLTGPAVNQDLAILHQFSLSAGDGATISSSFYVVPEPATALLSLLAFGAVIHRRNQAR